MIGIVLMALTGKVRLAPSGPFITDVDSGAPLEEGGGSTGLIWRGQGSGDAQDLDLVTPTDVDGLDDLDWTLPPGYHYDVRLDVQLNGTTGGQLIANVQFSEDDGDTWSAGSIVRDADFEVPRFGSPSFAEVDFNRTADGTAAINRVRVQLLGTSGMQVLPNATRLRIEQYVL